ncbi:hypothetical protein DERP_003854, partial [Dermatophagoides pteronyssinus]
IIIKNLLTYECGSYQPTCISFSYVKFDPLNLSFSYSMNLFGAISFFDHIIDRIHKRLMWIILVCKLKFNIFTIRESIWRVFFLRPNYRHNSDMISVDRICILEILDHVRLKFVVFTSRKMIWRVFLR